MYHGWLDYAMRDDRASMSSRKRVLELVRDENNETLDTKKKRSTKRFSLRAVRSDETLTDESVRETGALCAEGTETVIRQKVARRQCLDRGSSMTKETEKRCASL